MLAIKFIELETKIKFPSERIVNFTSTNAIDYSFLILGQIFWLIGDGWANGMLWIVSEIYVSNNYIFIDLSDIDQSIVHASF